MVCMENMTIEFDKQSGKWVGFIGDKPVFSSTSKYYVKQKLSKITPSFKAAKADEFGINKRFDFVSKIVGMVAAKTTASAIISGSGGLGKTHTVLKALHAAGLSNVTDLASFEVGAVVDLKKSFRIIKGYSTAKGLYRTLYESNGMTLVMDDVDSILKDPVALNILKGALDSYSDRYISWMADMKDDDLEKSFKFTGQIIFITNVPLEKLDQAIKSRSMCVDLSMSDDQKLERMEVIVKSEDFLPDVSNSSKREALEFLKQNKSSIANLSLRTLIQVSKIANSKESGWADLAKYVVSQGS